MAIYRNQLIAAGGGNTAVNTYDGSSWQTLFPLDQYESPAAACLLVSAPFVYVGSGDYNSLYPLTAYDGVTTVRIYNFYLYDPPLMFQNVFALASFRGLIYFGGSDFQRNALVAYSGGFSATVLQGFATDNRINALFVWNSTLVVGGAFGSIGGVGPYLAQLQSSTARRRNVDLGGYQCAAAG